MFQGLASVDQGNFLSFVSVAQIPKSRGWVTVKIAESDSISAIGNARNTPSVGPGNLSGNAQDGPSQDSGADVLGATTDS